MKKTILLAVAILAFTACKKDDDKLDPTTMIPVNIEHSDNPEHLTTLEIVECANNLHWWNAEEYSDQSVGVGFHDGQRDFVNVRFLMHGTLIIDQMGYYNPFLIEGTDMVLTEVHPNGKGMDTIAYIKNETLRIASIECRKAYDRRDYTECYKVFGDALTFIPTTATEWREMRATENPELIGTVWKNDSGSIEFRRTTFEINDGYVLKGDYTCITHSVMLNASRDTYGQGTLGVIDGNKMTIENKIYTKQ